MEFSSSIPQEVSPPHAPARHTRLYPLLILSLCLAAVTTVAYYTFPIWQKFRADSFASDAQDAYEAGRLSEAHSHIDSALAIRPTDPRYLRLAARILSKERKADSIAFYKALIRSSDATDKDRYEFIQLAFLFGRPQVAAPIIKEFLKRKPVAARSYFWAALLEDSLRHPNKALEHARAAFRENPDNQEHALFLAHLLAKNGSVDEAKKVLFTFAEKSITGRMPAIRALSTMPLTPPEVRQIIEWLRITPSSSAPDWALGYEEEKAKGVAR